ncbi:MAG: RadC family protein [Alphaproteobacteria bacterium]|nr:RadC family protein [Alphaproteobacteria bacterium]
MKDKSLELSLRAGHRDRLRQKFLDGELANYEIMELILGYAIPRKDVRPIARMLYKKFGGTFPILCASIDDLERIPGLGHNTAIFIKAIQKIIIDGYRSEAEEKPVLHNREQFDNYIRIMLGGRATEEMHVLYMDENLRLLKNELHSTGTIDCTVLYNNEIVKNALNMGAKFVALVHNHPIPGLGFSREDIDITEQLKNALLNVRIQLYDHFVVSGGVVYSMKDQHWLK